MSDLKSADEIMAEQDAADQSQPKRSGFEALPPSPPEAPVGAFPVASGDAAYPPKGVLQTPTQEEPATTVGPKELSEKTKAEQEAGRKAVEARQAKEQK